MSRAPALTAHQGLRVSGSRRQLCWHFGQIMLCFGGALHVEEHPWPLPTSCQQHRSPPSCDNENNASRHCPGARSALVRPNTKPAARRELRGSICAGRGQHCFLVAVAHL